MPARYPLLSLALIAAAWIGSIDPVLAATPKTSAPVASTGYIIVPLGRGHLNRLRVAATVESVKALLVLDTGAESSVLSDSKYKFLLPGNARQLPEKVPTTAIINGNRVPVGLARDFFVGGSNLGSLPIRIAPARYFAEHEMLYQKDKAVDYDGILGEEILRHYNAIIDVEHLLLYLNVDPRKKVDRGAAFIAAGYTRVPLADAGHDLSVECTLNGKLFRAIVDTGAPFTSLDSGMVSAAHLGVRDLPLRGAVIGTRAQSAGLVLGDTLMVGAFTATNVHMVSQPGLAEFFHTNYDSTRPLAALLGGDILAQNRAVIDIGEHALYLKRGGASTR